MNVLRRKRDIYIYTYAQKNINKESESYWNSCKTVEFLPVLSFFKKKFKEDETGHLKFL